MQKQVIRKCCKCKRSDVPLIGPDSKRLLCSECLAKLNLESQKKITDTYVLEKEPVKKGRK